MFMETLATGNVQVSGAEGEQTPQILREKVLLNLCLYLAPAPYKSDAAQTL